MSAGPVIFKNRILTVLCVWHQSSQAFGWRLGLGFQMKSLRRLLPVNVPWGQEFSGGPKSWTLVSHLGGFSPTPWVSAPGLHRPQRRHDPKTKGEAASNSQEHPKRVTHLQTEKKRGKNEKQRESGKKQGIKPVIKPLRENGR